MSRLHHVVLGITLLTATAVAHAAPITLNGEHFNVTYDSAQAGPWGQGAVSGSLDTVYFQPSTFAVASGGAEASTQALLQLTFSIDPGYTFAGISFAERGDYYLLRRGAVNATASVQGLNPDTAASTVLNLAPTSAWNQTDASTAWELAGDLSLGALGALQTLQITLDNSLFASAVAGDLGFIQKTYAGFRVLTRPAQVPEPSGLALVLAGLMAAGFIGRRNARRG